MSLKYRIRLENERVVGPFSVEEIGELFLKNHIKGTEQCQQFPVGDWKPLPTFVPLNEIIKTITIKINKTNSNIESSKINVKSQTNKNQKRDSKSSNSENSINITESPIVKFNEFKFVKEIKDDVNYEELEKEYKKKNPHMPKEVPMDETVVIRKFNNKAENLDKTTIVQPRLDAQ